ncbi:MAG: DNA-3-methyladenine glycosylase [Flavobacterium sp.]|nr:DNA-3-methyladenine glycosylase [Pedobacter sp.]
MKLPLSFYQQNDAVFIARKLLGKNIYTNIGGLLAGGIIVETEAYIGPDDRGSHAYKNRRTSRTQTMFAAGGITYMYVCYGIHNMLNVVTGKEDLPHAVLIRALEPNTGIDVMRERRQLFNQDQRLCSGPGVLTKALGLKKNHNGISLLDDLIWIEDRNMFIEDTDIISSARVGMNFDGPYQLIPWRFYIRSNPNVSRPHI